MFYFPVAELGCYLRSVPLARGGSDAVDWDLFTLVSKTGRSQTVTCADKKKNQKKLRGI